MSTISGVSGGSTGWENVKSSTRGAERRERMFAKVDTNGDGSVDSTELQGLLDNVAQTSGGTAANAEDTLKALDSDGNGTLDASELDAGMQSLMPAPSSTMDFAQQRGDDRVHGGGPPPEASAATDSTAGAGGSDSTNGLSSLLDSLFQAADGNGNGSLDKTELDALKTNLDAAIQSLTDGSGSVASASGGTASSSTGTTDGAGAGSGTSTASTDPLTATLTALANLVLKEYASTAAAGSSTRTAAGPSLNVTA